MQLKTDRANANWVRGSSVDIPATAKARACRNAIPALRVDCCRNCRDRVEAHVFRMTQLRDLSLPRGQKIAFLETGQRELRRVLNSS
jgi:hypothetical protein